MKAVMLIDAVLRKQRFTRDHPGVRIDHLTAPAWHWRACWADSNGQPHELVNGDLSLLLDQLADALDRYGHQL